MMLCLLNAKRIEMVPVEWQPNLFGIWAILRLLLLKSSMIKNFSSDFGTGGMFKTGNIDRMFFSECRSQLSKE